MRLGAMLGSLACLVSRSWVGLVVWRSVCSACAGYLTCACWCGCVDGGCLSAFLPVELVPALGGCLCAGLCGCVWRLWWESVRWALGGHGWVRVCAWTCTWWAACVV